MCFFLALISSQHVSELLFLFCRHLLGHELYVTVPPRGDQKRRIRPNNHLDVTFKSFESYLFPRSPFSDPPLGDGEHVTCSMTLAYYDQLSKYKFSVSTTCRSNCVMLPNKCARSPRHLALRGLELPGPKDTSRKTIRLGVA